MMSEPGFVRLKGLPGWCLNRGTGEIKRICLDLIRINKNHRSDQNRGNPLNRENLGSDNFKILVIH